MKIEFPGLGVLLGVLFIALKLTGYISWSWLWVLSPFWIPVAVFGGFALLVGVIMVVGAIARELR